MKTPEYGSYSGCYDLPGGRIDANEFDVPYEQIMKREITEEVGDIQYKFNPKPVAIGRHLVHAHQSRLKRELHIQYIFFEAEYLGGDICVSREHTEYKWVDMSAEKLEDLFKSGILEGMKMCFLG